MAVGPQFTGLPASGPVMTSPPPMRSPMAARPSPQNHSYGGGLADRPPRPMGRSNYDLNRIAERMYRQRKDPRLLFSMDWRNSMDANNAPSQPQFGPAGGTPPPTMPTRPGGRLVPGSRPGSSIWVSDPPATMEPPQRPGAAAPGGPPEVPPPASEGLAPPTMSPRGMPGTFGPPLLPWELPMQTPKAGGFGVTGLMPDPNKGAFNPQAPLAASPLAHYTPPPPALDFRPLPGNPGYGAPVVNGQVQKQFLPLPPPDAPLPANFQPESATRGGVRYAPPVTAKDSKSPDFTFEKDDMGRITGGVYPVQDENGKWRLQRVDINGDGKIAPAEAAKAAAAATAPAAAPVKVPSGNSFRPVQ